MRIQLLGALTSLLFLVSSNVSAGPSISIGSMYDVLKNDEQSQSKRIYNNGDSTAFVRVDVLEIDPNNKGAESRVETLKDNALVKERLLVTPMRLIIPPAGFQSVRMLWSGERTKERYFRVRFTPVLPQQNDAFNLNEEEIANYRQETIKAGVNVLAGYGTIMIVQPQQPQFSTSVDKKGTGIEISNRGNATVVVEDIRQCKRKNVDCTASSRAFILPGRSHTIENASGQVTTFSLQEGKSKRAMEI